MPNQLHTIINPKPSPIRSTMSRRTRSMSRPSHPGQQPQLPGRGRRTAGAAAPAAAARPADARFRNARPKVQCGNWVNDCAAVQD